MRRALLSHVRAVALALALSGGAATAALAQTPSRPEVLALAFEGNEAVASEVLANSILTRATECRSVVLAPFCWMGSEFALDRSFLSPREFEEDLLRIHVLYRMLGYRSAQVDTFLTRSEGNQVEILFRIEEGPPHRITSLEVLGVEELDDSSILEDLPLQVGDPLNTLAIGMVRDTLTQRLRDRGYAHADVLRSIFIPSGSLEAEVEFDVYTGPRARFGPIAVAGNEEVAEGVIRRMLPFDEGQVYSQSALFEAQRNVYNLEIFTHAAILQDLSNEPDSVVPLQVQVSEGDSRRVWTGAGWNTAECFDAEARWSSLNYFGGARRLVLRGRVSNLLAHTLDRSICRGAGSQEYGDVNWVVSADFTQPFIFSPRNALSASLYAERQSLQDVFIREAIGANLSLARTISRATTLSLSYRPQYVSLDAAEIFFCTSFLVCDPGDIDVLQAPNLLSPVGLTFTRDRTNRVLSPTAGYTVLLDFEHSSSATGSDFGYERAVAEWTGFMGLADDRIVLAARVRGGWLFPREFRGISAASASSDLRIAHPQKRFYAGGANSVRGFAQNQLGPQVASIEVESLLFAPGPDAVAVCTPEEIVALACDASPLEEESFTLRPSGGSRLFEGSVEVRFPVWGSFLRGAAFVDFGAVREGGVEFDLEDMVFTPGFGFRYSTPIGPVRIDLAYRRREPATLPVLTSQIRPYNPTIDQDSDRIAGPGGGRIDWVRLEDLALLEPRVPFDRFEEKWYRRLQLHLSIGQAF